MNKKDNTADTEIIRDVMEQVGRFEKEERRSKVMGFVVDILVLIVHLFLLAWVIQGLYIAFSM